MDVDSVGCTGDYLRVAVDASQGVLHQAEVDMIVISNAFLPQQQLQTARPGASCFGLDHQKIGECMISTVEGKHACVKIGQ